MASFIGGKKGKTKYHGVIDPEESRVAVPDPRFDWLCKHYKPAKEIPAFVSKQIYIYKKKTKAHFFFYS
jgi:hypothetical protein